MAKEPKWTEREIAAVKSLYPDFSRIFAVLKRTETAIRVKAKRLGLRIGKYWSDEEKGILRENYSTIDSREEFMALLPKRTWSQIKSMAFELGLNRNKRQYVEDREKVSKIRLGKPSNSSTKWPKGHIPWDKGIHRQCPWMAERNRRPEIRELVKKMRNSPEFISAMWEGFARRPNKPEQHLIDLMETNNLPYKYVGDGQFILGGKCPDFINVNGKKQVIELFGSYWHDIFDIAEKNDHYRQYGFDTLVIWQDELADEEATVKKIKTFARKRGS